jgi:hypothetical protein
MKSTFNLFTVLVCLFGATAFAQTTFSTSITSSGGENYSVSVTITPTAIVPVLSICDWGYNYDVAYDYDIQIVGGDNPTLYTLAGYLSCGSNQGIYFDLPNNGGSGSDVTQGNPWNSNSDCATATVESLLCDSIVIQIEGPGISNQTLSLAPTSNDNGDGQEWDMDGNNADTTNFIGTTNPTALKMRTNNIERMRITKDGKFGIGISNPLEKFELQGNLKLSGDIIFSSYANLTDTTDKILFFDKDGQSNYKTKGQLKSLMYENDCVALPAPVDPAPLGTKSVDTSGISLPTWANRIEGTKHILYTGTGCPAWVGIGTDLPDAKLDVIGGGRFRTGIRIGQQNESTTALHIENYLFGGKTKFDNLIVVKDHENNKVLQLNNDGLLRAREIKVDEVAWPDYVFKPNYELMPLNKVKEFIAQNGHLPNVPTAAEIEADGVNLGKTARITMEKVEELTLYMIEQQEQLEEQKELLKHQHQLIKEQQELVQQQQQEIDALKVK